MYNNYIVYFIFMFLEGCMFRNGKLVGLALVSSFLCSSGSCGVRAEGDNIDYRICLRSELKEFIPEDIVKKANDAIWLRNKGEFSESEKILKEVRAMRRNNGLEQYIFLPGDSLEPYSHLFNLQYIEDLDADYSWLYDTALPKELEELINCDTWYTGVIRTERNELKGTGVLSMLYNENTSKKLIVVAFKERELIRQKIASCVAKYGMKLEKHFIGAGKKEDANGISKKEEEENKEQQSLVRADAVSNESWGFLDIVFGIKDKVKSLLGLKEEEKEFVSKEEDFKREAKRQETEFSLSLLVKRFLDFVRRSDSIGGYKKKYEGINSTNLLTDESTNEN